MWSVFDQVLIKEDLLRADFTLELDLPLLALLSSDECLAALQQADVFGPDGRCLEALEVKELLGEAETSLEELSTVARPLLLPLRRPLQELRARGEQEELAQDVQAQLRALNQGELPERWHLGSAQLRERQGEEAQRGAAQRSEGGHTVWELGGWLLGFKLAQAAKEAKLLLNFSQDVCELRVKHHGRSPKVVVGCQRRSCKQALRPSRALAFVPVRFHISLVGCWDVKAFSR